MKSLRKMTKPTHSEEIQPVSGQEGIYMINDPSEFEYYSKIYILGI